MTVEEREQILQLLKRNGVPNCAYNGTNEEFILFKGSIGHLYLKEESMYVGLFGKDYEEKRKWADTRLRDATDKSSELSGWTFTIGKSKPKSEKAVWFTLKRDRQPWVARRDEVIRAVVKLYKILDDEKIFEADVRAPRTRSTATTQGNTTEHARVTKLALPPPKPVKYELSWNGWQAFRKYWDDFVKDWYTFISRKHTILEEATIRFGRASCINIDELPEPYMGCPENGDDCDAVILNLNPGMSDKYERQKFYSELNKSAWQIRELVDNYNCEFSRFIKDWNYLSTDNNKKALEKYKEDICGYGWWIKNSGARVNWLKRVYGNPNLDPQKVFALELCPFHSKKWEFDLDHDEKLREGIIQNTIGPALKAASQSKLPFAVAIGKPFYDIMEQIMAGCLAGATVKLEGEWYCKKETQVINGTKKEVRVLSNNVMGIWPNGAKEDTLRSYSLYNVSITDYVTARLLVTWTQSGNSAPKEDFKDVEKAIRDSIVE